MRLNVKRRAVEDVCGSFYEFLGVSKYSEGHEGVQGNHRRSRVHKEKFERVKRSSRFFKKVNHHVALAVLEKGIMEPSKNQ